MATDPPSSRGPLSELIKAALKQRELSAAAAARLIGVDPSYLSRALAGSRILSEEKLQQLADELRIERSHVLAAARGTTVSHPRGVESSGQNVDEVRANLPSVVLARAETPLTVKIVTDGSSFIDSAIFAWIFSKQPFLWANINCQLETLAWRDVPFGIADHEFAIGFYNKRTVGPPHSLNLEDATSEKPSSKYAIVHFADLAAFRGYGLVGRCDGELVPEIDDSNGAVKFLKQRQREKKTKLEKKRKLGENWTPEDERKLEEDSKLEIITMDVDGVERINNPLINAAGFNLIEDCQVTLIPSAEKALKYFCDGNGDLFIGGLPQLLALRKPGFAEIVNYNNNPFLISINSLFASLKVARDHRPLLHAATNLWFETVQQLHASPDYRKAVCADLCKRLEDRGERHSISDTVFDAVFGANHGRLERFADRPGALVGPIMSATERIFAEARNLEDRWFKESQRFFAGHLRLRLPDADEGS